MRSLALDVGDRRIGVAVSDPGGILASPLTIIEREEINADIRAISHIVKEQDAGIIIVGLPYSTNGGVGAQAQKVLEFAGDMQKSLSIPVEFRDESFTTVSARRLMLDIRSRKKRRTEKDDSIAAALILQSYLEENRSPETHDGHRPNIT
ncbi:Holliday junction resolvase RuvX [Chloroflexota bacterium]